jgi:peptidase M28-like protein
MLDVRIYRTGLAVAALALVVLAFSLTNQEGPRSASLAPEVFNGSNVYSTMASIATHDPARAPGSDGDKALAAQVAISFKASGFSVSTGSFSGRTVNGTRTLENVVASRPGMASGSIVIVAHRDARGSPALASLSGTATLMELARDLGGETLNRTIVLASTSGSEGTAGAIELASTVSGPIDAVIVLGDLASAHPRQPIVIPWSTRALVAPPVLRNTLAAAIQAQSTLNVGSTGIGGQFAHLAFPFTVSEQAPFEARGVPAVELSVSGEQSPAGDAAIAGTPQLTGLGRAVLATISALDGGPAVAGPSAYLLLDGKVVPGWAMSLFVLTLLIPVALTSIDALARARRRGHLIGRSAALVVASAVPFALAVGVVLAARLLGVISAAPPGPVAPGTVPLTGSGIAVLAVAALVVVGSAVGLRLVARAWLSPPTARAATTRADSRSRTIERPGDGVAVALVVVLWLVTLAIWAQNPFAAALLIPALHLWLWAIDPDARLVLPARLAMIALGLAPIVLVVVYYAGVLHFGVSDLIWSAALLVAGHAVSLLAAVEWCIVLGCLVSAATLVLAAARRPKAQPAAVTVRGPITYAGPGSLGGTKSALRR